MSAPIPEPVPEYGGCLWPADPGCLDTAWDAYDPALRERALALASSTLRRLSGNRVGHCPVTVRPCSPRGCTPAFVPYTGMQPGMDINGRWVNSCGCSGGCECATACEIALPAPVGRVEEVKVDGAIIAETDYQIQNGHILVWIGAGACPFPAVQNLALADTEVDTFSITYLNAYPVDLLGAQAVAMLALEFAKACTGKGACALPPNVTEVVRNGVSFSIAPGAFPGGYTGLRIVDAWIALWVPEDGPRRQSRVWSPDTNNQFRTTR